MSMKDCFHVDTWKPIKHHNNWRKLQLHSINNAELVKMDTKEGDGAGGSLYCLQEILIPAQNSITPHHSPHGVYVYI